MRTPAHQPPAPPHLAQILAVPGPVECMCTRRARAAGRPLLFAGIMAVATPPMRRRQRRFTTRPRCVPPSRHAQLQPAAPLTMCARDRCQAARAPLSSGESSPRCSFRLRKALRAPLVMSLYTVTLRWRRGPKSSRVGAARRCCSSCPARGAVPVSPWTSPLVAVPRRWRCVGPRCRRG